MNLNILCIFSDGGLFLCGATGAYNVFSLSPRVQIAGFMPQSTVFVSELYSSF